MDFIASFEKSSLPQIRSDLLHVHDRLFNRNDDQSNQLNYTLDDQHNCPISRAISTINEYGSILDTGPEKVIKVTTDYENSKVIIDSKKSSIKRQQHLDAIRFDIFCYVMLKHIRGGKNKFDALKKALVTNNVFSRHNTTDTDLKNEMLAQLRILSYLFEATDIDSRGSISWLDFTNLCLRIGRIQFKPSVKRSITLYHEKIRNSDGQAGKQIPVHTIFYIPETSLLFALDSDTPSTRIFDSSGKMLAHINVVDRFKRYLRGRGAIPPSGSGQFAQKQQERETLRIKSFERELSSQRGRMLSLVYIAPYDQYVFTGSGDYMVCCKLVASKQISETVKKDMDIEVCWYCRPPDPQVGIIYHKLTDCLITWPGEASDHNFYVWEVKTHKLKFRISKHKDCIVSVAEVTIDERIATCHYIASSSMDKKVVLWSTAPIAQLTDKLLKKLRVAETQDYELKGHLHTIRSLAYAKHHELLLGAGFDYIVYGWDINTKVLRLKIEGHYRSMVGVAVVYSPNEKVVTLDDIGVIKFWNVDKECGLYAMLTQTLTLNCSSNPTITKMIPAFGYGKTIVVLADLQLHYLLYEPESAENKRPVPHGVGFCEYNGRVWTVCRNTFNVINFSTGENLKALEFLDSDRITSIDQLASFKPLHHQSDLDNKGKYKTIDNEGNHIDPKDTVSCVAADVTGKKIFVGTADGRVLLFETLTFGLVLQLTNLSEDPFYLQQGGVIGLSYINRDDTLVGLWANGAAKVYSGCHRSRDEDEQTTTELYNLEEMMKLDEDFQFMKSFDSLASVENEGAKARFPGGQHGKGPSKRHLLREVDMSLISDHSMQSLAVSDLSNLIATASRNGTILVYDYLTMEFLSALGIPKHENLPVSLVEIAFIDSAPFLLAADSVGRISMWSVKPMTFKHITTFSIYHQVGFVDGISSKSNNANSHHRKKRNTQFAAHGAHTPLMGNGITILKSVHWVLSSVELQYEQKSSENMLLRSTSGSISHLVKQRDTVALGSPMRRSTNPILTASLVGKTVRGLRDAISAAQGISPDYNTRSSFSANDSPGKNIIRNDAGANRASTNIKANNQRWMIIVGDEAGMIMIADLTKLVVRAGGTDPNNLPRKNVNYPVYQTVLLKRLPLSSVSNIHGRSSLVITSNSNDKMHYSDMEIAVSSPVGSEINGESFLPGSHNSKRFMKGVVGIRKWYAYRKEPVRALSILFTASVNDYLVHATSVPANAELVNVIDDSDVSYPVRILTASEDGKVRLWSWLGYYLGQNYEPPQSDVILDAADNKDNTNGIGVDFEHDEEMDDDDDQDLDLMFDEQALINSNTFITTLIEDQTDDYNPEKSKGKIGDRKISMRRKTSTQNNGEAANNPTQAIMPKIARVGSSKAKPFQIDESVTNFAGSIDFRDDFQDEGYDIIFRPNSPTAKGALLAKRSSFLSVDSKYGGSSPVGRKTMDARLTTMLQQVYKNSNNLQIVQDSDPKSWKFPHTTVLTKFIIDKEYYLSNLEYSYDMHNFLDKVIAWTTPRLIRLFQILDADGPISATRIRTTSNSSSQFNNPEGGPSVQGIAKETSQMSGAHSGKHKNSLSAIMSNSVVSLESAGEVSAFQRFHKKQSLEVLINYIQGKDYFSSKLKNKPSSSQFFVNYELEMNRHNPLSKYNLDDYMESSVEKKDNSNGEYEDIPYGIFKEESKMKSLVLPITQQSSYATARSYEGNDPNISFNMSRNDGSFADSPNQIIKDLMKTATYDSRLLKGPSELSRTKVEADYQQLPDIKPLSNEPSLSLDSKFNENDKFAHMISKPFQRTYSRISNVASSDSNLGLKPKLNKSKSERKLDSIIDLFQLLPDEVSLKEKTNPEIQETKTIIDDDTKLFDGVMNALHNKIVDDTDEQKREVTRRAMNRPSSAPARKVSTIPVSARSTTEEAPIRNLAADERLITLSQHMDSILVRSRDDMDGKVNGYKPFDTNRKMLLMEKETRSTKKKAIRDADAYREAVDFDGIENVEKLEKEREKKKMDRIAQQTLDSGATDSFGPYSVKDALAFYNFVIQIEDLIPILAAVKTAAEAAVAAMANPVFNTRGRRRGSIHRFQSSLSVGTPTAAPTRRDSISKKERPIYGANKDDSAKIASPVTGLLRALLPSEEHVRLFQLKDLTSRKEATDYPALLLALQTFGEQTMEENITEAELIKIFFPFAVEYDRNKMFGFLRIAELLSIGFSSLNPPAAIARKSSARNINSHDESGERNVIIDNADAIVTQKKKLGMSLSTNILPNSSVNNGIPHSESMPQLQNQQLTDCKNHLNQSTPAKNAIASEVSELSRSNFTLGIRYTVRPSHTSGLKFWTIKKSMYNMMLEIIGYWVKEKELIISVLEVIEIIRGLVPWHSVQNYKIMRQLPILVHNRLTNVKMNTPLTVGIFEKIVNVVLEIKVIP